MSARCDKCGRFCGKDAREFYDEWQPDYWNGPRTRLLCGACTKVRKRKEKYRTL